MPQMIVGRPFGELELPNEHRLDPAALLHLGRRKPLAPPAAFGLWEIRERAPGDLETAKPLQQRFPKSRCEAVARPGDLERSFGPSQYPKTRASKVALNPHLSPRAGALSRFVPAVAAFGNQTLQPLGAHRAVRSARPALSSGESRMPFPDCLCHLWPSSPTLQPL